MRRCGLRGVVVVFGLLGGACFNPPGVADTTATTALPDTDDPPAATSVADTTATSAADVTSVTPTTGDPLTTTTTVDPTATTALDPTTTTTDDPSTGGGGLRFTPLAPISVDGALDLATFNVDDDGRDDLAISSSTLAGFAYVLGADPMVPIVVTAERSFPLLAVIADAGKQRNDLVLGYFATPSSLRLFRNVGAMDATEHFTPLPTPDCKRPIALAAADLNDDSLLDHVLSCAEYDSGVYLVLGDPNVYLSPAVVPLALGIRPSFLHLADVIGDTRLDLVAPYYEGGAVHVFVGKGDPVFDPAPAQVLPIPAAAGTDLGLVDKDDYPDFIVSQLETDQCALLLRTPDGLAAPQSFACGPQVRDLALGDFDGDGRDDLATIHLDMALRVAVNDGNGAFGEPTVLTIGPSAWRVTVGNYDGDADLDIAASSLNQVLIFLNES